jgi:hypothetical protein
MLIGFSQHFDMEIKKAEFDADFKSIEKKFLQKVICIKV